MIDSEKLTASTIDYIEAIDILTRRHGHAHTKDIAQHLKVKMPSVTIALRQLSQRGYVQYSSNRPVELTAAGQRIANRVARNHWALEAFFQRALALDEQTAHTVACSLDHIVGEDITRRLVVFSKAVSNRSDCASLAAYLTRAMEYINSVPQEHHDVISALPPRSRCIFEDGPIQGRINRGDSVTIGEKTLDGKQIALMTAKGRMLISIPEAEQSWVCVQESSEGE